MRKHLLLSLILLLGATRLMAVPAYNDWVAFRQPKSEILVNIRLHGDERVHWAESEEGYSLLHGPDGALFYAQPDGKGGMKPSEFLAMPKEMRTPEMDAFLRQTPKALRFSKEQVEVMTSMWKRVEQHASKSKTMADVTGEKRFLVILFAFQDQAFTHSKSEFEILFNQVGYSVNNATGSVHDYYYDVSHGQFSLHVDIVGPYTGTENTAFYGNTDNGYQAFATEAVEYASADIDFSDYDNDNDGYIDGLHIIFAGHGEEAGAGADKIWSHKWNIFSEPVYNNTIVNVYSCSPECGGSGTSGTTGGPGSNVGAITNIGVICHELGHVFGAPDYYDTDYAGSGGEFPGLGQWDIMSSGSWNNGGKTPAHHNPYTKIYIYRWATCDTLATPQQVRMRSVASCNTDFHRINTHTEGDFFLLENRQKEKWDANIPGTGMLVYHVHPDAHGASVSNFRHPQQIYILAQTTDTFPNSDPASYGLLNSVTTPFPGTTRRYSLDDNTCPWLRPWNGTPNNTPISFIRENSADHTVSFCFKGVEPASHNLSATGVSDQAVRLDWENYGNLQAMVVVSADGTFGTPQGRLRVGDTIDGGGIVAALATTNSACATGLDPLTLYHFRLYTKLTDSTYASTVLSAQGSTLGCGATAWEMEDFEASDQLPECWMGNWGLQSIGRAHSGLHCLASSTPGASITSAPATLEPGGTPSVVTFFARIGEGTSQIAVDCRPSISADWQQVGLFAHTPETSDWEYLCATLPTPSDYTLVRFRLEGDNAHASIDDIAFTQGYIAHATTSHGGSVTNEGYAVANRFDTIIYDIMPEPGYKLANLYIDGVARTNQVRDGKYIHRMRENVELRFTFMGDGTVGIDQPEAEQQPLLVYPNPTSGLLHIEGATLPVQLYDLYGRRLMEGTSTLDLRSLPKGIYLLRCGSQTQKIIKK